MSRMTQVLVATLMFATSTQSNASCDFSKDVKENADGSFTYSRECNVEVGKRIKELDLRRNQVDDLNKVITLKDLAIEKADQRAKLWMDTSNELNDKLIKYDSISKRSDTLYFVGGIAVTILSVWAAGQLRK